MSAKMYIRGRRIKSLDELMRQPFVIHQPPNAPGFAKVYHRGWFSSWQLHMAKCWIDAGSLYMVKVAYDCKRARAILAETWKDAPGIDLDDPIFRQGPYRTGTSANKPYTLTDFARPKPGGIR